MTSRADRKPARRSQQRSTVPEPEEPPNFDLSTPRFCLRHIVPGHDVEALDQALRAALALTLQKRAALTWREIHQAGRHASGTEYIDAASIRAHIPEAFSDRARFMAFRYCGKLPMVGIRVNDTFHILWIEAAFNALYDHE